MMFPLKLILLQLKQTFLWLIGAVDPESFNNNQEQEENKEA